MTARASGAEFEHQRPAGGAGLFCALDRGLVVGGHGWELDRRTIACRNDPYNGKIMDLPKDK